MTTNKLLQKSQIRNVSAPVQTAAQVVVKAQDVKENSFPVYRTDGSMITRTYRRRK